MLHETLQNWYRTAESKGEARGIVTGEMSFNVLNLGKALAGVITSIYRAGNEFLLPTYSQAR